MPSSTESIVEEAALEWLQQVGYTTIGGPDIAPGEPAAECETYRDVVLPKFISGELRVPEVRGFAQKADGVLSAQKGGA